MLPLSDILRDCPYVDAHRPWPRVIVNEKSWRAVSQILAAGRATLLGLWGEPQVVHMAVLDESIGSVAVLSLDCANGHFPSVGQFHAAAIRLERAVQDLFGLVPDDAPDPRAWLDHGRWGIRHPLGNRVTSTDAPAPYVFLPVEGASLHQIPVGPVHAGIIEPGHFRFTANGETVVRLEQRLGYVHKGIEGLMAGADVVRAAKLAGRTSGDSTVAYALAFGRAVEAATGTEAPPRAHYLRALMAELERIANHFWDFGGICNDASFSMIYAHCGILRERVLRACDTAFGHRLMRDCIVPGGTSVDLSQQGFTAVLSLLNEIRHTFQDIVSLYDDTASLQDRTVSTGVLKVELAREFGAGGFVGRASGRAFDARRSLPYAPYDLLSFDVPVREDGDVNARVWIRIREIEQSISLIEEILSQLPAGPHATAIPVRAGEGMALVEGFRGDVLVWLRLDEHGKIARCHLRDPSWFQWPLLEAAIEGNIVADFPICNKSFNCSYSGHDL